MKIRTAVMKHRPCEHCEPDCHNPDRLWCVWVVHGEIFQTMWGAYRTYEMAFDVAFRVATGYRRAQAG